MGGDDDIKLPCLRGKETRNLDTSHTLWELDPPPQTHTHTHTHTHTRWGHTSATHFSRSSVHCLWGAKQAMAHTLISMPVWNCLFLMSQTPWIGVAMALFCGGKQQAGLVTDCNTTITSIQLAQRCPLYVLVASGTQITREHLAAS